MIHPRQLIPRQRRLWLAGLVLLLVAAHPWILKIVALPLIVDDPVGRAQYLIVAGGDGRFDRAAEMFRDGAAQGMLSGPGRQRILVRLGILESGLVITQRALRQRGVPLEAWTIIPGQAEDQWDAARKLGAWLQTHPGVDVLVLTDRFESAKLMRLWRQCIAPQSLSQLHISALPHRVYDETNWWKSKDGVLACFNGYLSLGHLMLCGEPLQKAKDWDPDAYEDQLRALLRQ